MPRPAHRPSQRVVILDAVLTHLRSEGAPTVSLEAAARAAAVSKAGLMYHFATKEALVRALVDRVVDGHERELGALLDGDVDRAPASARLTAYLTWALTTEHDTVELIMLSDPKLWEQMTNRWSERLSPWLDVPADTPQPERSRLQAVRLIADGSWFADASGFLPIPADDRSALLESALRLLDRAPA